jgi:hypothetical protein
MKKLNIPKKAKRKPPEKPRPYLDCVAVEGCKVTFSPTFGANQFSESLPMKTFLRNSIDVLARVFIGLWWLLAAVGAVFVVERACYLLSGGL